MQFPFFLVVPPKPVPPQSHHVPENSPYYHSTIANLQTTIPSPLHVKNTKSRSQASRRGTRARCAAPLIPRSFEYSASHWTGLLTCSASNTTNPTSKTASAASATPKQSEAVFVFVRNKLFKQRRSSFRVSKTLSLQEMQEHRLQKRPNVPRVLAEVLLVDPRLQPE